jgi:alkylhydroperoxidase family enzyme
MESGLEAAKSVPEELKLLVSLKSAMLIGCPFWIDLNSAVSGGKGINEKQLADLAEFEKSPAFSDLEKQVLRYAVALTRTPAEVPEELFDRLRGHFSPEQMVELTAAIAWENFRARFNRGFGIESEGFTEGAACPVHVAPRGERHQIASSNDSGGTIGEPRSSGRI